MYFYITLQESLYRLLSLHTTLIEFDVDETRDLIERDSFDIVKVTRGLELREASERNMNFKRAEERLEWEDEHLSGSNKKKKGVFIYLPQPSREILPNPAEHPDLYDYLIIEIGSGGGGVDRERSHT